MSETALAKKENTSIAKKPQTIKDLLNSDAFQNSIANILPEHLTPTRMAAVAIAAITRTPKLKKCTPVSLLGCMMILSQLGLEPDGRNAHLIPYGTECKVIVDYKGLVDLVMRSGKVSKIHADVVCDKDTFSYADGVVQHEINFCEPRGEMYAVFCIITFKDGSEKSDVMAKDEVDAIRKRSQTPNAGPWKTDYNEMAKKTVFKRASKWLPLSADQISAIYDDADNPRKRNITHGGRSVSPLAKAGALAIEPDDFDIVLEPEPLPEPEKVETAEEKAEEKAEKEAEEELPM